MSGNTIPPHAKRLRDARISAGYATGADFATTHGVLESTYRHHENGTRGFDVPTAERYAKWLGSGTTAAWLLTGFQPAKAAAMLGYVGAGDLILPFEDQDWDALEAPPGLANPHAVIVRGESMLPVYRNGDILFFDERVTMFQDVIGQDCLVQIVEGPRQVKRLVKGTKRNSVRLHSYATGKNSEDVKLEWAAPVAWIKRA